MGAKLAHDDTALGQPELEKTALDGFYNAAQSLKLYRRAELADEEGDSLIEKLYVDSLPNEHIYQAMMKPNTAFLVGRRGTGKSTIFQRAQHGLKSQPGITSAYVDIKTVFETSQLESDVSSRLSQHDGAFSPGSLSKLLLSQAFIKAVIKEIRDDLEETLKVSLWQRIKAGSKARSVAESLEGLDGLAAEADVEKFLSVTQFRTVTFGNESTQSSASKSNVGADVSVSASAPKVSGTASTEGSASESEKESISYSDVLLRSFNIKDYILRLKEVLTDLGVSKLYVFVDDFSELPEDAMRVVVDTLLSPLNNWSEELVKFKVAAYPGRIYYGEIDQTKIDVFNLDLYNLYGTSDVGVMEDKAIDFTKRLVERRLAFFCGERYLDLFETRGIDEFWRVLFYATMANPRICGHILGYVYESHLLYGAKVGVTGIREAAKRYYEEKIDSYFSLTKFVQESFSERSSNYSLKELVGSIVTKARELRGYRGSSLFTYFGESRPPTSHFHVPTDLGGLLGSLELNFFVTKYFVMSDRDGRRVDIYALNFGLCQKFSIDFGRPRETRAHRTYFIERVFDYTPLLQAYIATNQEIVCDACGQRYDVAELPKLEFFGMLCANCKEGHCKVANLSRRYEAVLRSVDDQLLLPSTEIGIIHTLHSEGRGMFAREIAGELDCSYQLVAKRGKNLDERGLVDRVAADKGRRVYSLTEMTEQAYFSDIPGDALDIDDSH